MRVSQRGDICQLAAVAAVAASSDPSTAADETPQTRTTFEKQLLDWFYS